MSDQGHNAQSLIGATLSKIHARGILQIVIRNDRFSGYPEGSLKNAGNANYDVFRVRCLYATECNETN